jgi:hypothetical protein
VIQLVLPLHECVVESVADPTIDESVADPAAVEFVVNLVAADSAAETLHSIVDPATGGSTPIETSCLCV